MELFDLTLPLGPDLYIEPGDPVLSLEPAATHGVHGFEVTRIHLGSHTGTHVEAPRHFFPQGNALDSYPLERFFGHSVVLDCRAIASGGYDAEARVGLEEQLGWWPPVEQGRVLLWTEGAPVALWLAEMLSETGVGLVGIDASSIDEDPYPIHRFLLERDILIAEGLTGLHQTGAGPIECALLPLALTDTDASPARVVAWRPLRGDA